jgi:hypothetical protein
MLWENLRMGDKEIGAMLKAAMVGYQKFLLKVPNKKELKLGSTPKWLRYSSILIKSQLLLSLIMDRLSKLRPFSVTVLIKSHSLI